jgi:hypothetical protein
MGGVDLERLGAAQHPALALGHPPAQPEGVATPADPGADRQIVAGQLLPQLTADRGQVVLARVEASAGHAPPVAGRPVVGVADQQRPAGGVDQQAANGLPDRVDGDVGGDVHDQAARPPVGQPGHLAGRGHQRGQPGEVLVLGRPGLGAIATGTPSRRACRAASPSPDDSHQRCPSRQPRSSVRRPYRPGAEQNRITDAPPAAASSQGKSTPPSAQRVTPNRTAPSRNTLARSPGR